jgi:Protein of unknown function (DUF2786)
MAEGRDVLDKVGKLVALAQSDNEEEARTAAMQATRLMKEHKLVVVPLSEIERIQKVVGEANALAKKYEGEGQKKMMLGALAGYMLANGKML